MKCCEYTAAMLRHRATVQRYTETPDGMGGRVRAWSDHLTGLPCALVIKGGREQDQSGAWRAVHRVQVVARYCDITEADRIKVGTMTLNVRLVNNVELANRWLVLDCENGVPDEN